MAAALIASHIYPVVHRFLLESGLAKTLKAFDKDTAVGDDAEAVGPKKKVAKAIRKMELTAVCQAMLDASAAALVASDIYPAVRRFLEETGLAKTLKAFDKETSAGDGAEAVGSDKKLAKKLAKIELTAACQAAVDASIAAKALTNGAADEEAPKAKKRKHSEIEETPAEAEEAAEETYEPSKKERKKQKAEEQKSSGVPFSRVDYAKCMALIKDDRLIDNTHLAKQKFGGSVGDSWADAASVDMLKVKGKGFRKEMAKKKRASWRGCGELDQGVNSIKFADSSDDE